MFNIPLFSQVYNYLFPESNLENIQTKQNNYQNRFYYLSLLKDDNNKFSIHGFWPQYDENKYPTFCKEVEFNIDTLEPLMDELNEYWFSTEEKNQDFWRHEYQKHGSCVFTQMNEYQYFSKTLELYLQAVKLELPQKYYNSETQKCLIPVNLKFEFESESESELSSTDTNTVGR